MNNTDIAYLAGVMDGEGSIMFNNKAAAFPTPSLTIASTDKELLDWVVEVFGGHISKKKTYQTHHKDSYQWRLSGRKAVELVKLFYPYLRINRKIARAKILVEEYDLVVKPGGNYTPEEREARFEMIERFKAA